MTKKPDKPYTPSPAEIAAQAKFEASDKQPEDYDELASAFESFANSNVHLLEWARVYKSFAEQLRKMTNQTEW